MEIVESAVDLVYGVRCESAAGFGMEAVNAAKTGNNKASYLFPFGAGIRFVNDAILERSHLIPTLSEFREQFILVLEQLPHGTGRSQDAMESQEFVVYPQYFSEGFDAILDSVLYESSQTNSLGRDKGSVREPVFNEREYVFQLLTAKHTEVVNKLFLHYLDVIKLYCAPYYIRVKNIEFTPLERELIVFAMLLSRNRFAIRNYIDDIECNPNLENCDHPCRNTSNFDKDNFSQQDDMDTEIDSRMSTEAQCYDIDEVQKDSSTKHGAMGSGMTSNYSYNIHNNDKFMGYFKTIVHISILLRAILRNVSDSFYQQQSSANSPFQVNSTSPNPHISSPITRSRYHAKLISYLIGVDIVKEFKAIFHALFYFHKINVSSISFETMWSSKSLKDHFFTEFPKKGMFLQTIRLALTSFVLVFSDISEFSVEGREYLMSSMLRYNLLIRVIDLIKIVVQLQNQQTIADSNHMTGRHYPIPNVIISFSPKFCLDEYLFLVGHGSIAIQIMLKLWCSVVSPPINNHNNIISNNNTSNCMPTSDPPISNPEYKFIKASHLKSLVELIDTCFQGNAILETEEHLRSLLRVLNLLMSLVKYLELDDDREKSCSDLICFMLVLKNIDLLLFNFMKIHRKSARVVYPALKLYRKLLEYKLKESVSNLSFRDNTPDNRFSSTKFLVVFSVVEFVSFCPVLLGEVKPNEIMVTALLKTMHLIFTHFDYFSLVMTMAIILDNDCSIVNANNGILYDYYLVHFQRCSKDSFEENLNDMAMNSTNRWCNQFKNSLASPSSVIKEFNSFQKILIHQLISTLVSNGLANPKIASLIFSCICNIIQSIQSHLVESDESKKPQRSPSLLLENTVIHSDGLSDCQYILRLFHKNEYFEERNSATRRSISSDKIASSSSDAMESCRRVRFMRDESDCKSTSNSNSDMDDDDDMNNNNNHNNNNNNNNNNKGMEGDERQPLLFVVTNDMLDVIKDELCDHFQVQSSGVNPFREFQNNYQIHERDFVSLCEATYKSILHIQNMFRRHGSTSPITSTATTASSSNGSNNIFQSVASLSEYNNDGNRLKRSEIAADRGDESWKRSRKNELTYSISRTRQYCDSILNNQTNKSFSGQTAVSNSLFRGQIQSRNTTSSVRSASSTSAQSDRSSIFSDTSTSSRGSDSTLRQQATRVFHSLVNFSGLSPSESGNVTNRKTSNQSAKQ